MESIHRIGAVLDKKNRGRKMKMSIGVDLHKTQFTVCMLSEDRKIVDQAIYPTSEFVYKEFLEKDTLPESLLCS